MQILPRCRIRPFRRRTDPLPEIDLIPRQYGRDSPAAHGAPVVLHIPRLYSAVKIGKSLDAGGQFPASEIFAAREQLPFAFLQRELGIVDRYAASPRQAAANSDAHAQVRTGVVQMKAGPR